VSTLIEQLYLTGPLYWLTLFIFGLLVGSFLNVVILRLPKQMMHEWTSQCEALLAEEEEGEEEEEEEELSNAATVSSPPPGIVFPASHCPTCKTPLKWWHNLPVISYIFLRGKCFACEKPISLRYPLIELLTAGLTVLVGLYFPTTAVLPWLLLLTWCLITLSFIDIDHKLLPDNITLPLVWLGLLFNITANGFASPQDSIIGAVIGYMILWTVYQVHHAVTKKEGMGYGDFKLLSAAGAWLGWQYIPITLLLSAGAGVAIGISLMLIKKQGRDLQIPFGPYIAVAFLMALVWGDQLQRAYFNLIGLNV
jgi:leader peptidase (prepilin peptidase)/N-methyltransferase